MRAAAAAIWQTVHAERRRLVADLTGLTAEQWRAPSLCPGWDMPDVVAHLVDTARTTRSSFVRDLVVARFDFDRANERGIARAQQAEPLDTLHSLAYQLRTPVSFGGGRERAAGLRLVDPSAGTAWGTGDEVRADALDLLLAVSGRPVAPDLLDGAGAARLVNARTGTRDGD